MKLHQKIAGKMFGMFGYDLRRIDHYVTVARQKANHFHQMKSLEGFLLEKQLTHLLRRYEINCVLDVGANEGQYAATLRRLGYKNHIISFEPIRELYDKLKELSSTDPLWRVYPFALGRDDGCTKLNILESNMFSSILKPNLIACELYGNNVRVIKEEEIEVRRLGSILNSVIEEIRNPRVFLKMDTQGYDLEVISGLGKEVEKLVGLQSEVSVVQLYEKMPHLTEAISFYESLGFELAGLYPIWWDMDSSRVIEYDCVMMRTASLPWGTQAKSDSET